MLTTLKYEIIKRSGILVHIAEYLNELNMLVLEH